MKIVKLNTAKRVKATKKAVSNVRVDSVQSADLDSPSNAIESSRPLVIPLVNTFRDACESNMTQPVAASAESIEALDTRAPRYTSYPTADRFVEAFGPDDYARHLATRNMNHGVPLSVYLHIPFCSQLCFYCACNKTITQNYAKAEPYVERLIDELAMVDTHLTTSRRLRQIHWGGGTPTFLKASEIVRLMDAMRDTFDFEEAGEYSIEIDPRTVDRELLHVLKDQGFNRLSLGVQDFDRTVQAAVNRIQPMEMVDQVLSDSRALGFESTNFDLIYGLPCQSVEGYRKTVESVIQMRPDRIALYNYAHLPSRFKSQRLINSADMPSAEEKLAIFEMANELLDAAGYEYIELTRDDVLRRSLIMALMCQGEIDKESIEIAHLIDFDSHFASELISLEPLAKLGYIELSPRLVTVTATGRRKALRLIAGVFDRYLQDQNARDRFSKVL